MTESELLKSMVYLALEKDHNEGMDCFSLSPEDQADDLRMNNIGIARHSIAYVTPFVVSWREEFEDYKKTVG